MEKNHLPTGYFLAFLTIMIWSGWMIISRMGLLTTLTAFDVTFLRFTTAGLIMLPIAFKSRHLITRENRRDVLLMMIGAGAPYLMLCNMGFANAPANHGILTPGTMPLWVAIFSFFLFHERITKFRMAGYALIFIGAMYKLSLSGHGVEPADLFFLGGGLFWAIYTVTAKKHRYLSAMVATSFVATGTMFLIAIPYAIYQIIAPHPLPVVASIKQMIYQGIFTSVISLITYNRAMQIIGASQASSFAALAPVMVTLLAIPFLGEIPTGKDWVFVALMSAGVFLASGVIKKPQKKQSPALS